MSLALFFSNQSINFLKKNTKWFKDFKVFLCFDFFFFLLKLSFKRNSPVSIFHICFFLSFFILLCLLTIDVDDLVFSVEIGHSCTYFSFWPGSNDGCSPPQYSFLLSLHRKHYLFLEEALFCTISVATYFNNKTKTYIPYLVSKVPDCMWPFLLFCLHV